MTINNLKQREEKAAMDNQIRGFCHFAFQWSVRDAARFNPFLDFP